MATRFFIIGLMTLLVQTAHAQSEIKVYGEYLFIPGLSFEQALNEKLSVEVGTSFYSKKGGTWHGLQQKDNDLFFHAMLKKYRTNRKGKKNFFFGAYLRYWNSKSFAVDAEQLPIPESIQRLLDQDYTVTHKTIEYKVSLGLMVGYKWPVGSRMTMGINMGMGFSLPSTFWEKVFSYNQPVAVSQKGSAPIYGYVNHLDLVFQVAVGYRFAKQ